MINEIEFFVKIPAEIFWEADLVKSPILFQAELKNAVAVVLLGTFSPISSLFGCSSVFSSTMGFSSIFGDVLALFPKKSTRLKKK